MRRLIGTLIAGAALVATPVVAQQPKGRTVKLDVSPAAEAVIKKWMGSRDPVIDKSVRELGSVMQQLRALPSAPRLDLARMTALMRRQEALEAQIRTRGNNRTLAMLREMPEGDRMKFLRSMAQANRQAQSARAAPPR